MLSLLSYNSQTYLFRELIFLIYILGRRQLIKKLYVEALIASVSGVNFVALALPTGMVNLLVPP